MSKRTIVRKLLAPSASAFLGALLVTSVLVATPAVATAATAITLYVSQSGTASTGCTSPGTKACATVSEGLVAAKLWTGRAVTIEVAASPDAYLGSLTIDDPTSDNPLLVIAGAGAATTTLSSPTTSVSDVEIDAGNVVMSGLSIANGGEIESGGGTGVSLGGGVNNDGTLSLVGDELTDDWATGDGGAVYNNGKLTLTDDTLLYDTAGAEGGGVFNNSGATATLTDDTLSGDSATFSGGGVFNSTDATVILTSDTLSSDSAVDDSGGAVCNDGRATLKKDVITGDSAFQAGGVLNSGTLTLDEGSVSDDSGGGVSNLGTASLASDSISDDSGGGFFNDLNGVATLTGDTLADDSSGAVLNDGALVLTDDTLSNDSSISGGALANTAEGKATLTNDTLWNDSAVYGGGLANDGDVTLINVTLSDDSAELGGGVFNFNGGVVRATASVFDSAACYNNGGGAAITDGGYNLESDNSCGLGPKSKVSSATIDLAPVPGPNGSSGPETLAIGPSSSAFEEVPKSACTIKTDERGEHRPGYFGQTACDAGAFEFQTSVPSAPTDLRARPGDKSIMLTWKAPASTGNLAISGYRLYCSKTSPPPTAGAPAAQAGATATSGKVSALRNGTRYFCIVFAENAEGRSPPSPIVSARPR
jgi:hypothetical protein